MSIFKTSISTDELNRHREGSNVPKDELELIVRSRNEWKLRALQAEVKTGEAEAESDRLRLQIRDGVNLLKDARQTFHVALIQIKAVIVREGIDAAVACLDGILETLAKKQKEMN